MIDFLLSGVPLLILILAIIQLSLLWMGKGAVDTAAHLAARKFARSARSDFQNARQAAFLEAYRTCLDRPGGSLASVAMTTLDITREGGGNPDRAAAGEALCVRLTHGVELIVPWIDRILYALTPGQKIRVGDRYYLMIQSARWVTVE
jgi:hypothetical protein